MLACAKAVLRRADRGKSGLAVGPRMLDTGPSASLRHSERWFGNCHCPAWPWEHVPNGRQEPAMTILPWKKARLMVPDNVAKAERALTIVMAMPHPQGKGGMPKHLPDLAAGLSERGHVVVQFTYNRGDIQTKSMLFRLWNTLRSASLLLYHSLRVRPDIVHINSAYDRNALVRDIFVIGLFRIIFWKTGLFLKFHGSDARFLFESGRVWVWTTACMLSAVDKIGVLSQEEAANFCRAHPRSQAKVTVVKNVVNARAFQIGDRSLRRQYGIDDASPVYLFIARFIPGKGGRDVLRAFPLVRKEIPTARLWMVGDGPLMLEYRQIVTDMEIGDEVRFFGYVRPDQTPSFYASADALVFPTVTEGFAMSLFQAAASGLPILTTPIRAALDYFKDGEPALWIKRGDIDGLARTMITVWQDEPVRKRASAAGPRVVAQFSRAAVAHDYEAILRDIVRRRAGGRAA